MSSHIQHSGLLFIFVFFCSFYFGCTFAIYKYGLFLRGYDMILNSHWNYTFERCISTIQTKWHNKNKEINDHNEHRCFVDKNSFEDKKTKKSIRDFDLYHKYIWNVCLA